MSVSKRSQFEVLLDGRRAFDADAFRLAHSHLDPITVKDLYRFEYARWSTRPLIPAHIRRAILERDGHRCLNCGSTERLSLDHIRPWSRGGDDSIENLQTLCLSCNCSKGDRV